MGRVLGAFGLRGELRVFYYGEDPKLLTLADQVWLGAEPLVARPLQPVSLRVHKGRVLLQVQEVSERDGAQARAGQWLYLERSQLPQLPENEFYWFEIKGADVKDLGGKLLGKVLNINNNGSQDLLEIIGPRKQTAYIPMVKPMLHTLDVENSLVVVDLPPGLLEAQGWEDGQ